jgi:PAS domain S-box-containing protein
MTVVQHPATSLQTARFFEQVGSIGWIWFTYFFVWFAWLYARKPISSVFKIFIVIYTLVPSVLTYQQLFHYAIVSNHQYRSWGWFALWSKSFWMYLYFSSYISAVIIGIYFIILGLRNNDTHLFKRQSVIMLCTGILSFVFGSLVNVLLPIFYAQNSIYLADVTTLFWAFGLAYAVIRYQMLNITPFIAAGRIIAVMNDLLFLLDLKGRIISVNNAAVKSLGSSEKILTGLDFNKLIVEKELERNSILDLFSGSPSKSLDTELSIAPGPRIPVTLSISLIPGSGIVCVAHDISLQKVRTESLHEAKKMLETEVANATKELQKTNWLLTQEISGHKQATQALRETEERFRVIFENAPDGIYLAEKEGALLDANSEALRISGLTKNEIIGKPIDQLQLIVEPFTTTVNLSKNEFVIKRTDGCRLPIEHSTHIVQIGGRELLLGVVRDLSLRKKVEAEAEQLKAELHQAQKMEAIGRLAGGIAHDFNNLLGGIIGYTGLLYKHIDNQFPKAVDITNKINTIAHQATDRVAQLLAFARKGKYQVEPVDMHLIIEEVVNLLENTIDKKIKLKCILNARQTIISGDRSQLHSAILNLAVNARDALPNGGCITFVTDQVKITNGQGRNIGEIIEQQEFLKISVQDNGIGMDETIRTKIFEPFFTTKDVGKGTGLGLASVYGTVKNHNGFIEIESSIGKGTVFIVSLPLVKTVLPEPPVQTPTQTHAVHQAKILIVDDVQLLREMVTETLMIEGFITFECADGTKAIEWYKEHQGNCDLIILDLTMPDISGRECFTILKEINPSVKVIITSGHVMDTEIGEILKDGAVAFMQKPFESEDLIAAVRKALG